MNITIEVEDIVHRKVYVNKTILKGFLVSVNKCSSKACLLSTYKDFNSDSSNTNYQIQDDKLTCDISLCHNNENKVEHIRCSYWHRLHTKNQKEDRLFCPVYNCQPEKP